MRAVIVAALFAVSAVSAFACEPAHAPPTSTTPAPSLRATSPAPAPCATPLAPCANALAPCASAPAPAPSAIASASADADARAMSDAGADAAIASKEPASSASPAPPDMLLVPAGTFVMGADEGGELDEHPAHKVTLDAFFLDKTEVTNEAYGACVDAKICPPKATRADFERPRQPAVFVGWEDATKYCAWKGKRLPREAEFERAIRGDDGRIFPWGNEPPTPSRAVYARASPMEVGSKPDGRGPYGHDDLCGNVWEWMHDEYDPFAYTRPSAPAGKPGTCAEILLAQNQLRKERKQGFTGSNPIPNVCEHSIRGGAYNYGGKGLRATNRVHHAAGFRIAVLGFRCAKDAPSIAKQ